MGIGYTGRWDTTSGSANQTRWQPPKAQSVLLALGMAAIELDDSTNSKICSRRLCDFVQLLYFL